jgi:hypothetical protein
MLDKTRISKGLDMLLGVKPPLFTSKRKFFKMIASHYKGSMPKIDINTDVGNLQTSTKTRGSFMYCIVSYAFGGKCGSVTFKKHPKFKDAVIKLVDNIVLTDAQQMSLLKTGNTKHNVQSEVSKFIMTEAVKIGLGFEGPQKAARLSMVDFLKMVKKYGQTEKDATLEELRTIVKNIQESMGPEERIGLAMKISKTDDPEKIYPVILEELNRVARDVASKVNVMSSALQPMIPKLENQIQKLKESNDPKSLEQAERSEEWLQEFRDLTSKAEASGWGSAIAKTLGAAAIGAGVSYGMYKYKNRNEITDVLNNELSSDTDGNTDSIVRVETKEDEDKVAEVTVKTKEDEEDKVSEVKVPKASAEVKRPEASAEVKRPKASAEVKRPKASAEVKRPEDSAPLVDPTPPAEPVDLTPPVDVAVAKMLENEAEVKVHEKKASPPAPPVDVASNVASNVESMLAASPPAPPAPPVDVASMLADQPAFDITDFMQHMENEKYANKHCAENTREEIIKELSYLEGSLEKLPSPDEERRKKIKQVLTILKLCIDKKNG